MFNVLLFIDKTSVKVTSPISYDIPNEVFQILRRAMFLVLSMDLLERTYLFLVWIQIAGKNILLLITWLKSQL